MKFYCLTNTFSHSEGSCDKVPPKNPWLYNDFGRTPNDPVLVVDNLISIATGINVKNKFAWMAESSSIIGNGIQWIKDNISVIEKEFLCIFVNDKSLLPLSKVFEYVPAGSNMPWIKNYNIREKTKLVSIIASSKNATVGHKLRHEIIKNSKDDIDIYGRGYNPIDKKEEGMEDYMFSYCIENAKYDLYYTEKLTDAIACGTVPIYWGSDKISEIFDEQGIIRYEELENYELNKNTYESMLPYVKNNLNILKGMKCSDDIIQTKIMEIINE